MAEFFLELFSEEIPARMQAKAAEDLARLLGEALAALSPTDVRTFFGPRRLALAAELAASVAESRSVERGPRRSAPEQALAGFLRKHGAELGSLREEGDFWVLDKVSPGVTAASLITTALPALLRRFPWPKSMRWGGTSGFTWVRPLRRIICLLDSSVVPFDLRDGDDDGHGLVAGNLTEGHRFLAPGAFAVSSAADWQAGLRARNVIVDAAERRAMIAEGVAAIAAQAGYSVVDDPGLRDEVAGLVEWPVPLLGRIDAAFMDLPAEVMQVSMRVNQRYFALRGADGKAAPAFAFFANVPGNDGGGAIIAGNERVLSARFADARHFWDLDRRVTLESRVAALDAITFHAKLGSQGDRVRRVVKLSCYIAGKLAIDNRPPMRAAVLAKADLTTGMVGEFPDLQGIIGSYYALHDGEDRAVAAAIREHYSPKGPTDAIPSNLLGCIIALADKLDSLAGFFGIGEKPTGSGDPYALRRAGLGIIRIIREKQILLPLREAISQAGVNYEDLTLDSEDVLRFLVDRLRVQIRSEGLRVDILNAVIGDVTDGVFGFLDSEITPFTEFLNSADGKKFFNAFTRVNNILQKTLEKNEAYLGLPNEEDFQDAAERDLSQSLNKVNRELSYFVLKDRMFRDRLDTLCQLADPVENFFAAVSVNNRNEILRRNRLALLIQVRSEMLSVADFSKIDG